MYGYGGGSNRFGGGGYGAGGGFGNRFGGRQYQNPYSRFQNFNSFQNARRHQDLFYYDDYDECMHLDNDDDVSEFGSDLADTGGKVLDPHLSPFFLHFFLLPSPPHTISLIYYLHISLTYHTKRSADSVTDADWDAPGTNFWGPDRTDRLTEGNLRRVPQGTYEYMDEEWVDMPRVSGHYYGRPRRREDFGSWGERWGEY